MYQNQNNQPNQQNAQQASANSSRSGRTVVPEAKGALNQMKYEIASELGINLKQGYNGRSALPSGGLYRRLYDQTPHRTGRALHEREGVKPLLPIHLSGAVRHTWEDGP